LNNKICYKISKQQTLDKNMHTEVPTISGDYYFRLPGGHLVTSIVKNLLSKGAIASFVTDT